MVLEIVRPKSCWFRVKNVLTRVVVDVDEGSPGLLVRGPKGSPRSGRL